MQPLSLSLGGMSCGHCVKAVQNVLAAAPGVALDQVAVGSATLQFDPAVTSPAQIAALIEEEGYSVLSSSMSTSRVIA